MMSKEASNCGICDNSNRASICAVCVNYRLNEYNSLLKSLKSHRESLHSKLNELIAAKGKADEQLNWKVSHSEKLTNLKEKLCRNKEQLAQGKVKIERVSHDLKFKCGVLKSAHGTLEKNHVEKLEKFYSNLICTQSLGHMAITSERLHKQSVVIKRICKLFPQRLVHIDEEGVDGSSGQYDQICNVRLPRGLDPHSVPSEELAASLGSGKQAQQLNKSAWNVNSSMSSSTLLESAHMLPLTKNFSDHNLPTSAASFLFANEISDNGRNESLIDEWVIVEHPKFPPPPS